MPVVDQNRVVVLWGSKPDGSFERFPLGIEQARTFARENRALARTAFFGYEGANPIVIRLGDLTLRPQRALVSGSFFDVLAARPVLGRALRQDDDMRGAAPVAVLSHAGWLRVFGGDTNVIGRQFVQHTDGVTYTIVGVMPQGLDYPRGVDLWAPLMVATAANDLPYMAYYLIGRLTPGATVVTARDELTRYFGRPDASVWQRDVSGVVQTLPRVVVGDTRPAVFVFGAAAGLLLLITCINVANLLLVRGLARVREVAVRTALGASRARIVAQLLAENAVLAALGGLSGLLVAVAAVRGFVAFAPATLPRLDEVAVNVTALLAAAAITAGALAIFAIAPVLTTSRVDALDALRAGSRQSGSRRVRLTSELLVAGQVALAFIMLVAAGLIAQSFIKLQRAELAFDPTRLIIAELALSSEQFADVSRQHALLEELVPQLAAVPGVRAVTPVVAVPFSLGWSGRAGKEGQAPDEASRNPMLNMEVVAPGYFSMLGIPVIQGRAFSDVDRAGAPLVVILSESAARQYWPGETAIGKLVKMGPGLDRSLTVVGVVPDTRYRDLRDARPSIYFPLRQSFFPFAPITLVMRTEGTASVVPAVRQLLRQRHAGVTLAGAAPFKDFLAGPLAQPRLNAFLLALFAVAAMVLATVGLFGVMMLTVRQRARELGVRMALGATAASVARLVLQRGFMVAATGIVGGIAAATAGNRVVRALLYDVSPTDPATLALITALVLIVTALATLIPARLGARVDPAVVLRSEA